MLNCKEISKKNEEELKKDIACNVEKYGITPKLVVIMVGENPASKVYVRNKQKRCESVGIESETILFNDNVSQCELISKIEELNNDNTVHGILVQLPLPRHLDEYEIINKINPFKDVDCFTDVNRGKLWSGNPYVYPCTPKGIIDIFDHIGYDLTGKNVVIIGRSNIVGRPMAEMILQRNGTPTICHSKTNNLKEITRNSDVIISAVGKPKWLNEDYVISYKKTKSAIDGSYVDTLFSKNPLIIDVGINRDKDGKLCGDVDYDNVLPYAKDITTVPGGVGIMTVSSLLFNTFICYLKHL